MLKNISKLAQIALNLVEQYPNASGFSLQISNIIDELGVYAQFMLGEDGSNQILIKEQTLDELINLA